MPKSKLTEEYEKKATNIIIKTLIDIDKNIRSILISFDEKLKQGKPFEFMEELITFNIKIMQDFNDSMTAILYELINLRNQDLIPLSEQIELLKQYNKDFKTYAKKIENIFSDLEKRVENIYGTLDVTDTKARNESEASFDIAPPFHGSDTPEVRGGRSGSDSSSSESDRLSTRASSPENESEGSPATSKTPSPVQFTSSPPAESTPAEPTPDKPKLTGKHGRKSSH